MKKLIEAGGHVGRGKNWRVGNASGTGFDGGKEGILVKLYGRRGGESRWGGPKRGGWSLSMQMGVRKTQSQRG